MKRVGLILFLLVLAACQPGNDEYQGLSGRVQLYQIDEARLMSVLQTDGVVVLANPNSEWSQQAIPVLNEAAVLANQRVEYFNGVAFRESDSVVARQLLARLQTAPFLADYDPVLYDALYMPIAFRVERGVIVLAHVGTVQSHRLVAGEIPALTPTQQAELRGLYERLFQEQTSS
jgi:hypothetical protein